MNTTTPARTAISLKFKQQGIVLFFSLLALLALSLAAVSLVRSVDTNTLISGNLAFKQSAVGSAEIGVETAISWLNNTSLANANLYTDPSNPLNLDDFAHGYYSSVSSAVNVTEDIDWINESVLVSNADELNTVRLIIHRMCRTANTAAGTADCMTGMLPTNPDQGGVPQYSENCGDDPCPVTNKVPILYRVTARSEAPRSSISYVQAFVY